MFSRVVSLAMALWCVAAGNEWIRLRERELVAGDVVAHGVTWAVGLTGAGFALLAILPIAWPQWLSLQVDHWRARLSQPGLPIEQRSLRNVALVACVAGGFLWWQRWHQPTNLNETDQGAYLATASEYHERGGIPTVIRDLFSGRYTDANRHPLYPALLSLRPTITWGKLLSAFGVLASLVIILAISRSRECSTFPPLFLLFAAVNSSLAETAAMIGCESWVMIWMTLAWSLVRCNEDVRSTDSAEPLTLVQGHFGWIGALLGLAWLTKGTATPLAALTAGWWIAQRYRAGWRSIAISLAAFAAGWAIVASPLLVRNSIRFQSPLHNANTWLLFVDQFEDPQALSERISLRQAASDYLATHSLPELVRRESSGIVWETVIALRVLGGGEKTSIRVLSGAIIAALALFGVLMQPRPSSILVLVWSLGMFPLFAWYVPIAAGDRFVSPLVPFWLALASHGAGCLSLLCRPHRTPKD